METIKIELDRSIKTEWGFSIECNRDFRCPSVLRVTQDSIPYRQGMRKHDLLMKINGASTETLNHQEAILQIQNRDVKLELRRYTKLDYELLPPSPQVEIEIFNKSCQKSCSILERHPLLERGISNVSYNTSNKNYFPTPTSNTSVCENKSNNMTIQNWEPTKIDQKKFELLKSKNNEKKNPEPNQSENIQWDMLKDNCRFMCKTTTVKSCKNEYSVNGLCKRTVCPLVNYQYATVIEKDCILYLCSRIGNMKQCPDRHWEKIKLNKNEVKAAGQIDEHLKNWPANIIKKVKIKFSNLKTLVQRKRKLMNSTTVYIGKSRKVERNESRRERKALKRANLEKSIETDLIERRKSSVKRKIVIGEDCDDESEHSN